MKIQVLAAVAVLAGVNAMAQASTGYELWAESYGLTNRTDGFQWTDYDGDGKINLVEYAHAGNPTNSTDVGQEAVLAVNNGRMEYIYIIRIDTNLIHEVIAMQGPLVGWVPARIIVTETGPVGEDYLVCTNVIDTSSSVQIISLSLRYN